MTEILSSSAYLGIMLSIFGFIIGNLLKKKTGLALFNPILVSSILCIAVLSLLHLDYSAYSVSAKYLQYLVTPATVCLAIPLYENLHLLRGNIPAILAGILSGVLSSLLCVVLLGKLFGLDRAGIVTLLPKSVTTAIGVPVSEELGGYGSITAAVIILTGVLGNVCCEGFLKLLRITEPIARGIAIGTGSHAIGTARAFELGQAEGAMSSLAVVIAGLITILFLACFATTGI